MFSATPGYVVGGALRATRGLECETRVTVYHFCMHVNVGIACMRRFERSTLLTLGIL
jgi:hypothetical protein